MPSLYETISRKFDITKMIQSGMTTDTVRVCLQVTLILKLRFQSSQSKNK